MSLLVTCQCSNSYELKDEFAGKLVKCPRCGTVNRAEAAPLTPRSQADPAFDRDVFLLRQKHMAINEKYKVNDEQGNPIIFVERPAHLLRNMFAAVVGVVLAGVAVLGLMMALGFLSPELMDASIAADAAQEGAGEGASPETLALGTLVNLLTYLVAGGTFFVVFLGLSKKRHVTFYRDDSRRERLLDVQQDRKLQFPTVTFTVRDAAMTPIAQLRKNMLAAMLRKRWVAHSMDGRTLCIAQEDSIILSLLRRVLGPMFGLLRVNFVFRPSPNARPFGEFQRKMTILDRYALDLTPDRNRLLDRRLALAMGVMLDTGERR